MATGVNYDEGVIEPGASEELAGPAPAKPSSLAPVTRAERVSSMDVLRGFSLMGILVRVQLKVRVMQLSDARCSSNLPNLRSLVRRVELSSF